MNKRGCFKIIAMTVIMTVVVLQFTGCTSTPQTRVQKNPEMLATLSEQEREMVLRGAITEGMSRNAVYLAWGRPDSVATGSENGRPIETWRYSTLQPVYRYGGFGFGLGYGGGYRHGHYFYPGVAWNMGPDYVPMTSSVVRFRNGRVVAWEKAGR